MGIGWHEYPEQDTKSVGRRVKVTFMYDLNNIFHGVVLRDDLREPYVMIIELDDGRMVLGTECQYMYA